VIVKDEAKPVITDVADVTVNCGASTLPAATGTATATDNCGGAVNITFSDVLSNNGNTITRTWRATDAGGNFATSSQTITKGMSFTTSLTSVPTSSVYTGGVSTNLYLGYGAQSTTLQVGSLPSAGAPYSYSWNGNTARLSNTNTANPIFTPATTGSGTSAFAVTITNRFGCTFTASISICVTDIRVPNTSGAGAKVYLCHKSNGKNGGTQTTEVLVSQVASHIGNNNCGSNGQDRLGRCDQAPCAGTVATSTTDLITKTTSKESGMELKTAVTEEALKVTVMPNPSTTYFTLKLESKYETPVNMRVMDGTGRVVDARTKIGSNSSLQIGHNYSSGTYYAEMIQGTTRKVVQLIKAKG
jgi:hypothetical protein